MLFYFEKLACHSRRARRFAFCNVTRYPVPAAVPYVIRKRLLSSLASRCNASRYSLGAARRGKFSPPRGSHHTAQMTGAVALPPRILVLVANTRGITRKVCAGGHCRSRLGKKRPRSLDTTEILQDADVGHTKQGPFLRERSTGKEMDRIPPRNSREDWLNQVVHQDRLTLISSIFSFPV
ncbi:hypothetical protein ALC56_12914 [Trachymyrmex septentrionalis]|uniref:Uncharacterized protein n=1 Tax=Trachymyrmex septentrionalis TaxID=34720 RepID=A0A151JTC2_9HYME|nr:hypothetical protein ALC56_12914 [Trachymyrmex septentrionalis]